MMDTGLANRLRAAGLRVVECSGWQSRGSSSFNPRGSVNHHTAGSANGATPSLNTCINGRPDLPGPLCNVMQSREPDGNDIAYVIAAGRANHAGEGSWRGLSGNSSVYGLEIEHTGTSPLSQGRQNIAARIHAAMFGGDPGMVCQHYEWTTRKIDAATNVNGDQFRSLVASGGTAGGGKDWFDMATIEDLKNAVRSVLNEGTGKGLTNWKDTNKEILQVARSTYNAANAGNSATQEIRTGLRDETNVPIPANRVGGRIKRTDANVTEMHDAVMPEPPPEGKRRE